MYSIKIKLVTVIMILIVGMLGLSAFLLINEKKKELTADILFQTQSFAELTSESIVDNYNLYLSQGGFIYFNKEISSIFQKTQDVENISIFNYSGEMLYSSIQERDQQYQGEQRIISNPVVLAQVKAHNPSLLTENGELVFIKKDEDGNISYVDSQEIELPEFSPLTRVQYIVYPINDEFAVAYYVNYTNLDELIRADTLRTVYLAVLGMLFALFIAIFFANKITKPLKKLTKSSGIIAQGDFQHRVTIKTHDELEILGDAFNQMAADLDKGTKALVYKERVGKELELAQKIQKRLIPKDLPELKGLDVSAGLVPAEEIGGDVYDFIQRNDNDTMFYLGDVTGHGVPSGLLASIANAMFFREQSTDDLKQTMLDVNKVLKYKSPPNMFITLCLLNWNKLEGKLTYINAGHEQMIHYKSVDTKSSLLEAGGIALGMFPDIRKMINVKEVPLQSGDCAVLYSDGIPEAWKSQTEQYGMERFKAAVESYGHLQTAVEIRNAILQNVKEFIGDYKQMDDITIIVIKKPAA